jgi:hypothetical protein
MNTYIVSQNPNNGQWYVCGYCGQNPTNGKSLYMQVSDGYAKRSEAQAQIARYMAADRAARAELAV